MSKTTSELALNMLAEKTKTVLVEKYKYEIELNEDYNLVISVEKGHLVLSKYLIEKTMEDIHDFDQMVDYLNKQILDVKNNNKAQEFKWEAIKDLIILSPQFPHEHMDLCVTCKEPNIPLENFGLVAVYAINFATQIVYVSKIMLEKWGVSELDLYIESIKNIKKLVRFEDKRLELDKGSIRFKIGVSEDASIISSGIFTIDERQFKEMYPKGFIVSMPTRNFLFITSLNDYNLSAVINMTEDLYSKETNYYKLQFPLIFSDGQWSAVVEEEDTLNQFN